jgi:hypothetical protein
MLKVYRNAKYNNGTKELGGIKVYLSKVTDTRALLDFLGKK